MRIGANYGYLQPCLREAFSISQLPHCQRERVIMNKWGHSKTYVPQKIAMHGRHGNEPVVMSKALLMTFTNLVYIILLRSAHVSGQ